MRLNSAALQISGLANRAKKSPVVQHKLEQYVAAVPGLSTVAHPALACSVSTRWNSEKTCIESHVQKRPAVKQLTADRDLSLKKYQLTDPQWELAEQLVSELKVRLCAFNNANFADIADLT
jgi:hypothetical protein